MGQVWGGLSAAATLATNGQRVLLLEKHWRPGGYAGSFVRGRFEFEIALHVLSGLDLEGKRGSLYRNFESLGIMKRVDFVRVDNFYKAVYPDMEITVPANREAAEEVLVDAFPHELEGIKRFLDRMAATNRALALLTRTGDISQKEVKEDFLAYRGKTLADVLYADVKDAKARAVLSQIMGYFGLPPSQVSYIVYATAYDTLLRYGIAQIKGTSQTLSNAFVDIIEEKNGEVRLNCGVKKILTEGNRVKGVLTENNEKILSDYIVSNVNPLTTCAAMIGVDKVPHSFFDNLQKHEIAVGTLNVYMGLDAPHQELGIDEFETFINLGYDFDANWSKSRVSVEPADFAVATYNCAYSEASPPGTTIMVLCTLSYAEPWYKIPPSEYVATKNRMAEKMLERTEKVYPGVREHMEVVEVSTPLTNMRYTGNPGGSILGTPYSPNNVFLDRLPQEGPLKGLYFAGAWTQIGGGFQTCITSGIMAAQKLMLEKMKK
ncbi:MAG: NAD(P)/FAD-dependent oxidoreductase [Candidatus Jordarchaeaceae archaeon]